MSEQVGGTSNDLGTIGPREVVVRGNAEGFTQDIAVGPHQLTAEELKDMGGDDEGPTPYDLLLAALGSCTSITVTLYAQRKSWPLQEVITRLRHSRIHVTDCAECETEEGTINRIELGIEFVGPLTAPVTAVRAPMIRLQFTATEPVRSRTEQNNGSTNNAENRRIKAYSRTP